MKILMLGTRFAGISDWLKCAGHVLVTEEGPLTLGNVNETAPDLIVSYNYRHRVPKNIIDLVSGRAINLHISFLPYNRGTLPNVWSFLEDTPKGVTLHYMDERIDTGDIIAQKEVLMDDSIQTLSSSYWLLHKEIQELFKEVWGKIIAGEIDAQPQKGTGTVHYAREYREIIEPLISDKGWDISVVELKRRYAEFMCQSGRRVS